MAVQTADGWLMACESAHCVQVKFNEDDTVYMRATFSSAVLWFTKAEWDAFTAGVKLGEFDDLA